MQITHKIALDFAVQGPTPTLCAVQGDCGTRLVQITLTENGTAWTIPSDAAVSIRYRRPDGTGGVYDTLSDGSSAWSAGDGTLDLIIAPELLCLEGLTVVSAAITREEAVLGTFCFHVIAAPDPSADIPPADKYISLGSTIGELKAYVDEKVASGLGLLTAETVTTDTPEDSETVAVTALSLDQSALSLNAGATRQLTCTVSPADAANQDVTWETSDSAVATVSAGLVTAVGSGNCTITARSAENSTVCATCTVAVAAVSGTVTVLFSSLDTLVTGAILTSTGSTVTVSTGSYVSFPYIEGMYVSTYMNESWIASGKPAVMVYDPTAAAYQDAGAELIGTRLYGITLTGYDAGSTVYVNSYNIGSQDANCYYQYETEA